MKIFTTDIPNDRNIYSDTIETKKGDYVIIPETIRDINVLWNDVLFYVIQQKCIQDPVSDNFDIL